MRAVDQRPRGQGADEIGHGSPAEPFDAPPDELAQDRGRRLRVAEGGVDGLYLDLQHLNQPGQAGGLAGGQLQQETPELGGVDHRVLERSGQAPTQDPGVEGIVAVLDQDRPPGEVEEPAASVAELRGAGQHLAPDEVAPLGVRIDRGPGVDEGVEETERARQPKALGADLEHQKRPVSGGLDVHGDELGHLERRQRAQRGKVGLDHRGVPGDRLDRTPWLELEDAARHRLGHLLDQ
ncbi:MAG: hypothetical protein NVS9B1_10740 [Candidatus Dormibacteraceae bacterium]